MVFIALSVDLQINQFPNEVTMKQQERDDLALWRQFQQGNIAAFTTLVNQYSEPLYGYGTRFSSDEELVRDAIQDVFLVLWKRKEHLSETSSIKLYLMKALRQRIIRELPKWQRMTPLDDASVDTLSFSIDIEETAAIPKEIRDKLRTYIDSLSPRQKELLYLRFYQGLKQEKVAELMGLNRQSAYNLQRRALIALRKLIDYESIVAYISQLVFASCCFL